MGHSFEDLRGSKALVCNREINGEQGGATVWCIVLADGFILECGKGWGEQRAHVLADMINASQPERLEEDALRAAAQQGAK